MHKICIRILRQEFWRAQNNVCNVIDSCGVLFEIISFITVPIVTVSCVCMTYTIRVNLYDHSVRAVGCGGVSDHFAERVHVVEKKRSGTECVVEERTSNFRGP